MASPRGATSVFALILLSCFLMFADASSAAATTEGVDAGDKLMMDRFLRWQAAYNRSYPTEEEKQRRFEVYRQNMEHIEATNRDGNLTYQLGENQFTDLTPEEFLDMYTMKGPMHDEKPINASFSDGAAVDAPTSVDWRSQDAVTPIKNQGQCHPADGDQDGDQDGEHEGNSVDGHPNQLAEGGQQEEDPPADDLSVGHRRRPRGSHGSCNARRLDLGPELKVDGVKVCHIPQNNITGAKTLLDTLMVDANYHTPVMQKAMPMLKAAAAQEVAKSQSVTSSSHVSSRGRHRHEDLRNSLSLHDGRDTINSHYEEHIRDNQRYEEERRDWRTDDRQDNRQEDRQDPPPRHNRDDRH
ncbi:hypothetical protein PR202_gb25928 [Eleusine coracana subsp. coracana]|uniref:Cathepsin propeptide inhibitor domain-containing protein n=1 Tax=Eleusine coracana subsp. coracana TaxID=191504 RepID=A0AAV5FQJ2_ELECO|nr:hypothetical protein PR202_gb25928 [Eleusine coracana subsp. coracana]